MRMDWETFEVEVLKTLVRISFIGPEYSKGGRDGIREKETHEYQLTPNLDMEKIIEVQQRKLSRDIEQFVGKGNMDELREVLV